MVKKMGEWSPCEKPIAEDHTEKGHKIWGRFPREYKDNGNVGELGYLEWEAMGSFG